MLNICIIDDEQDARLLLREQLSDLNIDYRILGEADSKKSAIKLLKNNQPDIVFLDIDLKDGTGFEVLSALPPPQYALIFVTAFNEFALQAFRANALDYLSKPISHDDLQQSLNKLKKHVSLPFYQSQITEMVTASKNRKINKLVLQTAEGTHFLPIKDIIHLESSGSYTTVCTTNGEKIVVSTHLGHFDYLTANESFSEYTSEPFFRIHQSHIIRLSSVRKLLKLPEGEFVLLENGDKIPIARRRRDPFLMAMNG